MAFYQHATTFAGRPIADVPIGRPLPAVDGPVAWRFSMWDYDGGADYEPFEPFRVAFDEFVDQAGATVEALVSGAWGYAAFNDAPIDQLCAAAPRLPRLRALFLGDQTSEECEVSWMRVDDVSPLLTAYPALHTLRARGGASLGFSPVRHGALRELALESGGLPAETVDAVLRSDLPGLSALELWLGVENYGGDTTVADLAPLLAGDVLPALRHLGLRNAGIADEVAAALATAPLVPRLETLDLSLGTLGDDGANALLAGQPLGHLRRLDLHHHYLSPDVADRLVAALPGVPVDVSDPQEADENDDEEYRYTAVSE